MIIAANGEVYRLFFQHDEVPRRLRYGKLAKQNVEGLEHELYQEEKFLGAVKGARFTADPSRQARFDSLRHLLRAPRTVCRLDRAKGVDESGKRIWVQIGAADVTLKRDERFSKSEGSLYAFRKMLRYLAEVRVDASTRQAIAQTYLASRPRKKSMAELKRENAALRAQIEQMQADVRSLVD